MIEVFKTTLNLEELKAKRESLMQETLRYSC